MTDVPQQFEQENMDELRSMLNDQAQIIAELRAHLALDDPRITSKQRARTLDPSEDLLHYYPSIEERDLYTERSDSDDDEDRFEMSEYLYTKDVVYTAPQLTNYEGVSLSTVDKGWDKKIAGVQAKLAHITRPLDTAAHDLVHYADPESQEGIIALTLANTARLMVVDVIKHLSSLRRDAVFTSLKLLATTKNKQAPLVPIEKLAERRKVSDLVRTNTKVFKKDGYKDKPRKDKKDSDSTSGSGTDKKTAPHKDHKNVGKGSHNKYNNKPSNHGKPGDHSRNNGEQQNKSGKGREEKSDQ